MSYVEDHGVRLWYSIEGSGEPLVLTGGFGCLQNQWEWIMQYLTSNFRVINWNYRGAGQSDRMWAEDIPLIGGSTIWNLSLTPLRSKK